MNSIPPVAAARNCWSCAAQVTTADVQCSSCREIQPPSPSLSPFERLGLATRYDLDEPTVEAAWLHKTRAVHPDRMASRSNRSRRHAAEHAAALNDAQRLLREPFSRAEWLLKAGHGSMAAAPNHLLMSLMEAREAADDTEARPAVIAAAAAAFHAAMATVAAGFRDESPDLPSVAASLGEAKMWARLVADLGGPALARGLDR
jgi:molecular chaperone HscB